MECTQIDEHCSSFLIIWSHFHTFCISSTKVHSHVYLKYSFKCILITKLYDKRYILRKQNNVPFYLYCRIFCSLMFFYKKKCKNVQKLCLKVRNIDKKYWKKYSLLPHLICSYCLVQSFVLSTGITFFVLLFSVQA